MDDRFVVLSKKPGKSGTTQAKGRVARSLLRIATFYSPNPRGWRGRPKRGERNKQRPLCFAFS